MDRGSSIGNFRRGFVSNPMGITPSHATARRLAYGEEMSRAEPTTSRVNMKSLQRSLRNQFDQLSSSFSKSKPSVPSERKQAGHGDSKKFADYAPNEPPFIPSLILHCIEAIRSRGIRRKGLYAKLRNPDVVSFLMKEFSKGKIPDLSEVSISTICSTLLRFMRSLSEPLVTFELRDEFIRAALISKKGGGNGALLTVISKLPRVNRDTLAYLILHLQQVSRSPECAMSVDKLARIFGPTLLAYGDIELTDETLDIETEKQYEVFRRLMSISAHEWARFINFDALENRLMRETRTTISPATSTSDLDDDDMF
ncbi:rac GTPase-activating protein 1-like [Venturia canescens]|uniref:rac GTPase-activating protein 1-like n=1 Tax=Venturia canescens TaxID=32260 RepID=UPI001C9D5994|nr:rac GTPase-activating protein 1-like [Venturia canescens]